MSALAFACGCGIAIGLLLIAAGRSHEPSRKPSRIDPRRAGIASAAATVAAFVTGWPVGALLVGAAAYAAPTLVGGKKAAEAAIARTEAVAAWTETLRDTLAATAGLQRAIVATAAVAPGPIAAEVGALAASLRRRQPLSLALRTFADDIADATADLVVSTLVLAYERQGANLSALLGALAGSAREEAAMQRRVIADRAKVRAAVSVITVFTLGACGLLVVFNRSFLAPYDGAFGQVMLGLDGVLFGVGLWTLQRLAGMSTTERVLTAGAAPVAAQ